MNSGIVLRWVFVCLKELLCQRIHFTQILQKFQKSTMLVARDYNLPTKITRFQFNESQYQSEKPTVNDCFSILYDLFFPLIFAYSRLNDYNKRFKGNTETLKISRGHLVPRGIFNKNDDLNAANATYTLTNAAPQVGY